MQLSAVMMFVGVTCGAYRNTCFGIGQLVSTTSDGPTKAQNYALSPSELRLIFGQNLRILSQPYASVSELSRQLGINRTQYNRYLSGESFPRPDILARICAFFGVDARILLEPVSDLDTLADPLIGEELAPFIGRGAVDVPDALLPSGFYRFSRRSFLDGSRFVVGIVWIFRKSRATYIKGFEARAAMEAQGLPTSRKHRVFQGLIMRQDEGLAAIISRRNSMTFSFNYLHPASSFENNYWVGYVARTIREAPDGERITRLVYEYLGPTAKSAVGAARTTGFIEEQNLLPLHRRYLQVNKPFA